VKRGELEGEDSSEDMPASDQVFLVTGKRRKIRGSGDASERGKNEGNTKKVKVLVSAKDQLKM